MSACGRPQRRPSLFFIGMLRPPCPNSATRQHSRKHPHPVKAAYRTLCRHSAAAAPHYVVAAQTMNHSLLITYSLTAPFTHHKYEIRAAYGELYCARQIRILPTWRRQAGLFSVLNISQLHIALQGHSLTLVDMSHCPEHYRSMAVVRPIERASSASGTDARSRWSTPLFVFGVMKE